MVPSHEKHARSCRSDRIEKAPRLGRRATSSAQEVEHKSGQLESWTISVEQAPQLVAKSKSEPKRAGQSGREQGGKRNGER